MAIYLMVLESIILRLHLFHHLFLQSLINLQAVYTLPFYYYSFLNHLHLIQNIRLHLIGRQLLKRFFYLLFHDGCRNASSYHLSSFDYNWCRRDCFLVDLNLRKIWPHPQLLTQQSIDQILVSFLFIFFLKFRPLQNLSDTNPFDNVYKYKNRNPDVLNTHHHIHHISNCIHLMVFYYFY